jgi:hypothetical protein
MRDINVRDLLDLVVSDVDNLHEKLSQLYLWKYDYAMTAAKATTAAGASFLVGLFIALLQAKDRPIAVGRILTSLAKANRVPIGAVNWLRYAIEVSNAGIPAPEVARQKRPGDVPCKAWRCLSLATIPWAPVKV